MADVPNEARLLAARDRATAAVVRAYGAGRLSDAACARLLDTVQEVGDANLLDRLAVQVDQAPAAAVRSLVGAGDPAADRASGDGDGVGWPRGAGFDPAGSAVERDGPIRTTGFGLHDPARRDGARGGGQLAGRGDGRARLPALDAVDLALAARAASARRSWTADRRRVSLVAVIALLVALVVLGAVLVLAARSDLPSQPAALARGSIGSVVVPGSRLGLPARSAG
jgi:hypothetical protein